VDIRGYGKSDRPPEMSLAPDKNPPLVHTETAVKDVGSAVDYVLKRRNATKLNLMGWSWGTAIMGWYTAQHNDKVNKLVLYAPLWLRKADTASLTDPGAKLGAYRSVTREAAKNRWLTGVPEDKKAGLIPPGWFEALADVRDYWSAGKPQYDPADIRVPTFLAHAEWDQDLPSYMLYAYFAKLTNAPYKSYVEIGEGTHTVIMEKNRLLLFQAVQQFLDTAFEPGM
jgi:pimeloyl-ACP methyl ester carboxylesterase